ncbi:hypothetical protein [Archangium sp.]|uniref:hypothetical protein n=1 Tax=Archangium sp. TaxID=1872627 RepID=UPI00389AF74F
MAPPSPTESPTARVWPWSERVLAWALVVTAGLALAYHAGYLAVPIVDDAAISLAYGRTFFEGHGFRITPYSQPVEGFSNPLWTVLLGFSRWLPLAPETFTHVLGLLLGLLALPAFALWGPLSEDRPLRVEDALAPWVAALNPSYVYWIASGMETGLQAFLLGLCGALLLRGLRTGTGAGVGCALGLLCLTRPEGVLYTAAAGGLWLVHRAVERRWTGRQAAGIAAWLALLVGGWLVVRWGYFADVLPNTYYAKRLWLFDGATYVRGFLQAYPVLHPVAAAGLVLGLAGGGAGGRRGALVALFAASGGYFAWRSGDWMREWRFVAPLVPLLGAAMAVGLSGVRRLSAKAAARGLVWPARVAVTLAFAAAGRVLGPALRDSLGRSPGVKATPELPYAFIAEQARKVDRLAESLGQRHPLVGHPDMGGQAMVLRQADILDVAGLADYAMAHHAGNLPAMEDYLVSEGPPVLLDAHGPSGHLRQLPQLMARVHPVGGPAYQLNGLTATEDPRCPGGKATVLASSAEELAHQFEQDIEESQAQRGLGRWRCARAYKATSELPSSRERERLADLAQARGEEWVKQGQLLPALRLYSLATLLDDGNAHRRRETEKLRERVFPPPPRP